MKVNSTKVREKSAVSVELRSTDMLRLRETSYKSYFSKTKGKKHRRNTHDC